MARPPRTWSLATSVEAVPGATILSAHGRIGIRTARAFADALAAAGAGPVVIDLTGVDYISGPGLTALRDAASVGGRRAVVCGLQEAVRITLELAGLLDDLPAEHTRETALARLSG